MENSDVIEKANRCFNYQFIFNGLKYLEGNKEIFEKLYDSLHATLCYSFFEDSGQFKIRIITWDNQKHFESFFLKNPLTIIIDQEIPAHIRDYFKNSLVLPPDELDGSILEEYAHELHLNINKNSLKIKNNEAMLKSNMLSKEDQKSDHNGFLKNIYKNLFKTNPDDGEERYSPAVLIESEQKEQTRRVTSYKYPQLAGLKGKEYAKAYQRIKSVERRSKEFPESEVSGAVKAEPVRDESKKESSNDVEKIMQLISILSTEVKDPGKLSEIINKIISVC